MKGGYIMADSEFGRCVCCGDPVERELLDKKGECLYCREEASGKANYSACFARIPQNRVPYAGRANDADHWERKCLNMGGSPDSLYPPGYKDNRS